MQRKAASSGQTSACKEVLIVWSHGQQLAKLIGEEVLSMHEKTQGVIWFQRSPLWGSASCKLNLTSAHALALGGAGLPRLQTSACPSQTCHHTMISEHHAVRSIPDCVELHVQSEHICNATIGPLYFLRTLPSSSKQVSVKTTCRPEHALGLSVHMRLHDAT